MSNPLDHKPFKNDLAGKSAKKKQRFKPNPLSGFGKGTDVTVTKNKLAYPPGRHRLVFRSMLDGVKLIESLKAEVNDVSTMPPVKLSKGEQTPAVRPPIGFPSLKESVNSHAYELTPSTQEDTDRYGVPPGAIKYKYTGPGSNDKGMNFGPPTFIVNTVTDPYGTSGDQWSDWFDGDSTYTGSLEAVADCLAADDWNMLFGEMPSGHQDESSPMQVPNE